MGPIPWARTLRIEVIGEWDASPVWSAQSSLIDRLVSVEAIAPSLIWIGRLPQLP